MEDANMECVAHPRIEWMITWIKVLNCLSPGIEYEGEGEGNMMQLHSHNKILQQAQLIQEHNAFI